MATTIHVKAKSKWKDVEINNTSFPQEALDGLICFQQLDDYELLNYNGSEKKTKQSKSKNKAGKDDVESKQKKGKQKKDKQSSSNEVSQEVPDSGGNKKKNRKKKQSNKAAENIITGGQKIEVLNEVMGESSEPFTLDTERQENKMKRKTEATSSGSPKKKQKMGKDSSSAKKRQVKEKEPLPDIDTTGMEGWVGMYVPEDVLKALKLNKFYEPTPIQRQVLASAIRDRMDVVGAAQTGSGKTLAFGIPILHYILEYRSKRGESDESDEQNSSEDDNDDDDDVSDQDIVDSEGEEDDEQENVDDDEEDDDDDDDGDDGSAEEVDEEEDQSGESGDEDLAHSDEEDLEDIGDGIGCVHVVKDADFSWLEKKGPSKVSGVKTYPLALVLEPTRELAIQVRNHLRAVAKYTDIRIEAIVGGLAPQKQQRLLRQCPDVLVATPGRLWDLVQQGEVYLSQVEKTRVLVIDEADRMIEKGHFEELSNLLAKMNSPELIEKRHTYVFSATLTMLHSGPQRQLKKKKKIKLDEKHKLEMLMKNIGLKPKPKIVDLSPKVGTVETLTEARINCTKEEKDIYLYYFLKQYPGRTLVFANSKDGIRRLLSVFNMLQCSPLPLHADMHQRQRLKNLDRFTANPNGFLLASDVAARGLDIPNVQHVIHYQVPHTVENYVHRSGRTARALKEGLSVMLIGPDDMKNYKKIIHTLNKSEDLPMFPVEDQYLTEYRRRVHIVRQIETKEYRFNKSKRQNNWFTKAAEELGVDIDDENLLDDLGDEKAQQDHKRYIKQMKAELAMLLKVPVLPRSVGGKYPTKGGKLILPPSKSIEKNAIMHLKKDKQNQDKMLEHIKRHPTVVKEKKKKKWKKKNKN